MSQPITPRKSALLRPLFKLLMLLLVAVLTLQLYFVGRIALMAVLAPESTAFQRSEIFRVVITTGSLKWRHNWVPYAEI